MEFKIELKKFNRLNGHLKGSVIAIVCGIILSCTSRPIASDEIPESFESNIKRIGLGNSFAFIDKGDEFYFTHILLSESGFKCTFFIGFKNGQFKYRFPAYRMNELRKTYLEKIPLQAKKELALNKIDTFEVERQKCTPEIAEREKTAGEIATDVFATILYAPLFPLGLIGMVTFGAEDTVRSIKDSFLEKRMDRLRLGMSESEVRSLLDRKMAAKNSGAYSYYSIDYGAYGRLVMAFEKDRLTGMTRGNGR